MHKSLTNEAIGAMSPFSFITPGAVESEMVTITNLATQLAREMMANPTPPQLKADYYTFYNEWLVFRLNNKGWIARANAATWEKVEEFKERLKDFQKKFVALGYRTSISVLTGAGGFPFRTIAIAGGAALGLYFFSKIMIGRYVRRRMTG